MFFSLGIGCYAKLSCSVVSDSATPWTVVHQAPLSTGNSTGKSTGVGCHALLQGIFPTQRPNPGLPNCRKILYHVSHQGSPRNLEWVAYPFSRGSSQPRNQTRVSCIAGRFFYQLSYQGSPKEYTTVSQEFILCMASWISWPRRTLKSSYDLCPGNH